MTCYENVNKVMGLKAANSYWNPVYYDPNRRTITKKLLFTSEKELQSELRALVWLAIATKRALILPNVLGNDGIGTVDLHMGRALWPGFRLAYIKRDIQVDIVEPAFYWRIKRDYSKPLHESQYGRNMSQSVQEVAIPDPYIFAIEDGINLNKLVALVLPITHPRIILHSLPKAQYRKYLDKSKFGGSSASNIDLDRESVNNLKAWADDSVGIYDSFDKEFASYGRVYSPTTSYMYDNRNEYKGKFFLENMRICRKVFAPMRGNRSCFDKCD